MKRAIISFTLLTFWLLSISSQNLNSTYFLNEWSHRNKSNASFAPEYGHFSFFGVTQLNLSSNTGISNYLFKAPGITKKVTFLHESVSAPLFLDNLESNIYIKQGLNLNLFSFGFYTLHNGFWTFDVSLKENLNVNLPKDLFRMAKVGMQYSQNMFDLKNLNINQSNMAEVSLGYSKDINKNLRVGFNAKLLVGLSYAQIKYDKFDVTLNNDKYALSASGESQIMSEFLTFEKDTENNYDFTKPKFDMSKLNPAGYGAAVDLGITYKPFKRLTLAAAINDLGYMNWNASSIKLGRANSNVVFTGFENVNVDSINVDKQLEQLKDDASNLVKFKDSIPVSNFRENIPYNINVSGEFSIFANNKHDILLGLLYHNYNSTNYKVNELVGALTLKPFSWFTVSGTYEFLREDFTRYGLAMNFSPRWINLFIASDFSAPRIDSKLYYPVDRFDFSLTFGGSFIIGKPRDSDKDGVVDQLDNSPETPSDVFVDKKGAPLDTDADGVPDYLDKCTNTPIEVNGMVNEYGCPLDSDGDGVFDYLDISPNTPVAARGFIDIQGKPLDTDNDKVFDYLDKCANTPADVEVDSVGCPADKDKDGVADYLDLCLGTPTLAIGMVDKNGCPLDSDNDGVADYLDLCAGTPIEARAFVNKNGCSPDADNDGIEDYLDKCPNTPIEARGMVDEKGCPRDADGDGILDYLDNCPKIPGVAANKGCPEVQKEVKKLFQKALQGIQFEAGKTVIKASSFVILNQIAKVLIDNPTYLIEVRGHTDNVGKPASNLILSEKRALAVKEYLIGKGVATERMTSNGFGDKLPVAPNTSAANKAKNRRVEFVVTFEETITK
jgi:outer membrane protein OmpA-like peptidoglycan-associated protein